MPCVPDRFDVFLRCSWANRELAVEVERALAAAGLPVFRDEEGTNHPDAALAGRLRTWIEDT
jgi:hypothetical protein